MYTIVITKRRSDRSQITAAICAAIYVLSVTPRHTQERFTMHFARVGRVVKLRSCVTRCRLSLESYRSCTSDIETSGEREGKEKAVEMKK